MIPLHTPDSKREKPARRGSCEDAPKTERRSVEPFQTITDSGRVTPVFGAGVVPPVPRGATLRELGSTSSTSQQVSSDFLRQQLGHTRDSDAQDLKIPIFYPVSCPFGHPLTQFDAICEVFTHVLRG